tara:strand:+ start:520 stop:840 length:321 start_codon:yes stop_codon:yes gene_type:complete
MRWFILLIIAFVLGAISNFLFPFLANSAPVSTRVCLQHDQFTTMLQTEYQETIAGAGISYDGWITEIYTNPDSKTWTIVQTRPDSGVTCPRAYGNNWIFSNQDMGA